jgi:hypothetical protein
VSFIPRLTKILTIHLSEETELEIEIENIIKSTATKQIEPIISYTYILVNLNILFYLIGGMNEWW